MVSQFGCQIQTTPTVHCQTSNYTVDCPEPIVSTVGRAIKISHPLIATLYRKHHPSLRPPNPLPPNQHRPPPPGGAVTVIPVYAAAPTSSPNQSPHTSPRTRPSSTIHAPTSPLPSGYASKRYALSAVVAIMMPTTWPATTKTASTMWWYGGRLCSRAKPRIEDGDVHDGGS